MNFKEYFETEFDKDLIIFKNAIPKRAKHYSENPFTVQYFYLIPHYNFLTQINSNNRAYFAVSLFWFVLIDQVTFTHFKDKYVMYCNNFSKIKFVGNCTAPSLMASQCGHNQHPQLILKAINDYENKGNEGAFYDKLFDDYIMKVPRERIYYKEVFLESKDIIEKNLNKFLSTNNLSIPSNLFWNMCLNEI